ncbi:MAG TPA: hypothetical protein PJ991_10540 [Kiritimatiellia bacterium]|nr:hypothetical protein [Kiritimatiellia bacterium]
MNAMVIRLALTVLTLFPLMIPELIAQEVPTNKPAADKSLTNEVAKLKAELTAYKSREVMVSNLLNRSESMAQPTIEKKILPGREVAYLHEQVFDELIEELHWKWVLIIPFPNYVMTNAADRVLTKIENELGMFPPDDASQVATDTVERIANIHLKLNNPEWLTRTTSFWGSFRLYG